MSWKEERDEAVQARVDAALEAAVKEGRIVGGVTRVARNGVLIAKGVAGLADRETARPMTETTSFRYASLTKPVLAAVTLELIGRGVLSLDDTVEKWLPEFTPRFQGKPVPITVRQLLTHTSGLGYSFLEGNDGPYHQAGVSDGLDQPGLSLEENLRRLGSVELKFAPGSAWLYSLSFDVLGAVIERATKKTLPEVMTEILTGPLEMTSTSFTAKAASALATPYADGKPEPIRMTDGIFVPFAAAGAVFAPSRATDPRSYPSGGAGLVGNAEDFHRFLEAVRTRSKIAPRQWLEEMFKDQIPGLESPILGPGWGYGYGAGILRDPVAAGSPMSAGSIRWGGAFGNCWFIDPAAGLSVVTLTNTAFEGMAGKVRTDIELAAFGRGA